ncbi:MAG: GldG family protein [Akkermansia sp.]|nr:GldG family protein [Akkermansia sp.]
MSKTKFTGHPDARRPKGNPLAWINLLLLSIIVLACNYIGCREYARMDLSEQESYSISERTRNVLASQRIQNRETPIHVIFAFQRTATGYARMYSLLEEYVRHSNGKIEVECFDPLREPNRAREISQIYGVDFDQNLCVVDARANHTVPLRTFEDKDSSDRMHVRIRPGASFMKYEVLPDESRRIVALMMDEVLCSAITEAVEGDLRRMYVVEGKGGVSRDDQTLLENLGLITSSLNIQLAWVNLNEVEMMPENAEGLIIISPQTDFTENEMRVVREFWEREGRNSVFVALDPTNTNLPMLYRFLREQGIRPNADRVLLRNRNRAYYDISAVMPKGLNCTRAFWNNTTQVDGQSMSLTLEHADENHAAMRRLNTYPLLLSTAEYYGETRRDREPTFTPQEDIAGPLCLQAAVTRGSNNDPNNLSTMIVTGNVDMLARTNARREQTDYLRSIWAWMVHRPEYAGKSANQDLTVKIDLNRHTRSAVEHITLIIMPALALLIALGIWNTRRH